jgi:hypothetical protein
MERSILFNLQQKRNSERRQVRRKTPTIGFEDNATNMKPNNTKAFSHIQPEFPFRC